MDDFLHEINSKGNTVADAGEDGVLQLVERIFPDHLLRPEGITVPTFNDDCAVIGKSMIGVEEEIVITSDVLVESADFLFEWMSYYDLGYKSLMVNLSDLASMGSDPIGMVVVVGLRDETPLLQLESFLDGLRKAAEKFNVILLGGDLSESEKFFCNITAIGKVPSGQVLQRGGVQEGDIVCVTGSPGESRAGLFISLGEVRNVTAGERTFLVPFFRPEARIDAGKILLNNGGIRGCIDLSDGIARDVSRIAARNKLRIEIDGDLLPASDKLVNFWKSRNYDPVREIVTGGEDFELMFCCSPEDFESLSRKITKETGLALNRIGNVESGSGAFINMPDGSQREIRSWGFDHFEKSGDAI